LQIVSLHICARVHFYRAMQYSAKRGLAIARSPHVCLSVRPSVTLADCDYIRWKSWKLIQLAQHLALRSPKAIHLLPGEHEEILGETRGKWEKVACWSTEAAISQKRIVTFPLWRYCPICAPAPHFFPTPPTSSPPEFSRVSLGVGGWPAFGLGAQSEGVGLFVRAMKWFYFSNDSRRHVECLDALYLLGLCIHALVYLLTSLLTYLHSWPREYKTGNISETVEDRAKVSIICLYKVVHGLRLPSKRMTLNDLCARLRVIDSLNAAKMAKYSLVVLTPTTCRVLCLLLIYLLHRFHVASCTFKLDVAISNDKIELE